MLKHKCMEVFWNTQIFPKQIFRRRWRSQKKNNNNNKQKKNT